MSKQYPRYRGFPIRIRQAGDLFRADAWDSFTGKWMRGDWCDGKELSESRIIMRINERYGREIERFCTEMEKANG